MKYFLLGIGLLFLSGCQEGEWRMDNKLRAKLFQECLTLIPKGPERTVYNDWAEVVDSCESAARSQSLYWEKYK